MGILNLGANSKVRGSGHLILNALRALTIVGLGTIMVACWAMIVISGLTKHFDFFDTISHFFIFGVSVFLVISEVNLFSNYFANNWPVLSPTHSLAWLGLAMVMIGCQILGDLVKPAYAQDNLGLPIWRLVLAAGILSITFGVSNMAVSVVFRDSSQRITARQIRSDGNLAAPAFKDPGYDTSSYTSYPTRDNYSQRSGSGSLRQKEEEERPSAARRITRMLNPKNLNFRKSRPQISAPMPLGGSGGGFSPDVEHGASDHFNDRASPIIPAVQRPPTALHPAFTGSSRYSAAHMSQFPNEKF
ncbi:hypothetical protein QBC47DRAFT_221012 [Echria macrotheca]|uniref:DUF7598 domain-containing protein n=1 Tax=Echria macrotheca TaxID=438768 RepID=A0AAJ0BB38_9PEZI|nr:hypothetical protein QBC47DRAFT_221012 [Echria macrotheca]